MKTKKSRDPLFYIVQPMISFPEVQMQETFVVKKTDEKSESLLQEVNESIEKEELVEDKQVEKEHTKHPEEEKSVEDEVLTADKVQETIHHYNEEQKEETTPAESFKKRPTPALKRVKAFKEMSIEERLYYIEHFPKQLPPVPCIFITKDQSLRGFLSSRSEDAIEVKQMNQTVVEISMDDLVDIKMIGLR